MLSFQCHILASGRVKFSFVNFWWPSASSNFLVKESWAAFGRPNFPAHSLSRNFSCGSIPAFYPLYFFPVDIYVLRGQRNVFFIRGRPRFFTRKFDEAEGHQVVTKESLGGRRPPKSFSQENFRRPNAIKQLRRKIWAAEGSPRFFQKKIRGGRNEILTRPEAKIRHKKFSIIIWSDCNNKAPKMHKKSEEK